MTADATRTGLPELTRHQGLLHVASILIGLCFATSCIHDPHVERMQQLNRHEEAFRVYLAGGSPGEAVKANVEIEALAASLAMAIKKREQMERVEADDDDRILYRRATRTAVENWLLLAEYWRENGDSEEARQTYQRVLDMYTSARFEPHQDQAAQGLRELKALEAGGEGREQ